MTTSPTGAIIDPNAAKPMSPFAAFKSIWGNWDLIVTMATREVVGRYKGSFLGLAWSFFNPVLMLVVYTFVFSVVFKARWSAQADESKAQFAVVLFAGMIIHAFFAEVVSRAPSLILSNVNFVKKVVFPLEILPVVSVGAALFHTAISVVVLVAASLILNGGLPWTVLLFPVVLLPLAVLALGFGWFLASLGTYLRDLAQAIGVIVMVMGLLSPVFYPVSALPAGMRPWLYVNPLTFIIEQTREVAIWGRPPSWLGLASYLVVSLLFAWAGFVWFQRTRKGFADVL